MAAIRKGKGVAALLRTGLSASSLILASILGGATGGGGAVLYDTAIGNGVDTSGFASLPLRAGGTDGADAIAGAPTSLDSGNVSYNAGTRTFTDTLGSLPIATWAGALTVGQTYHLVLSYTTNSYANLQIKDQSGTLQWQDTLNAAKQNGSGLTFLVDAVFTATGTDLVLSGYNDLFKGTITLLKCAPTSSSTLGGRRFYVNSSTGNDANNGLQAQAPATPLATLAAALWFAENGRGDQILVAEGTSYAAGLPDVSPTGGVNATYPFVIQSYDPADPTNEAKLGRAVGNNRPALNTGSTVSKTICFGSSGGSYRAFRGLRFNPTTSAPLMSVNVVAFSSGAADYWLFENMVFPYTSMSIDNSTGPRRLQKAIFRNCAFHNQYGDHSQGIYAAYTDGLTIEDSVFWANGRLSGVSRDASQATGGASMFNHPIYTQDDTRNTLVRRCVFIDTATDGGVLKGGATYQQNLVIRCPIAVGLGGGDNYSIDAPSGVVIDASYNAAIGSNMVNSTGAVGWGFSTVNGMQNNSVVHHNVLARNDQASGVAYKADSSSDSNSVALPNYTDFNHNVSYLWNASGSSSSFTGTMTHATVANTVWDDPTGGTNTNVGSVSFSNAYTETSLLAALGYASETAAINDWIANPQQHGWRQGVKLMLQGYGIDISAMPYIG
jgi:hypothetical protein